MTSLEKLIRDVAEDFHLELTDADVARAVKIIREECPAGTEAGKVYDAVKDYFTN